MNAKGWWGYLVLSAFILFCFSCGGGGGGGGSEVSGDNSVVLTAEDDNYEAFVDSLLTVNAPGVLINDHASDGSALNITDYDSISAQGHAVTMAIDGGFTYNSPVYTINDSFAYTVTDGLDQKTATVNLTVKVPAYYEVQKIIASDEEAGDLFGTSVAISGDYAVVGAYLEASAGTESGAAYIYYRNQGGDNMWGEIKKLIGSDTDASDNFGKSVAISGDYVLVGAPLSGAYNGAAYLFYRNEGGADMWGEVKKLIASDAEADDRFGESVSMSGDDIIVGASYEDASGANSGAAYIFNRDQGGNGNWGEVTKIMGSSPAPADYFGWSVSISGDSAIVGATERAITAPRLGKAYVFDRNQGGSDAWGEVALLRASDPETIDEFGWSVSISGDYVLVGLGLETALAKIGDAYLFNRNEGGANNWGEVKKLNASDAFPGDHFGRSVCLEGDYALIGAEADSYLFHRNQNGENNWGEVQKLIASDGGGGALFGKSVSLDGTKAIIGASSDVITNTGMAYIFERE